MNEFRHYLRQVKAVPTPHHTKKTLPTFKPFWFKDLDTCSHVLKLVKKVKPPLVRPYTGPHKVLDRHESKKYFKIEVNGEPRVVSTDLLKPAYYIPDFEDFEIMPGQLFLESPSTQVQSPPPPPPTPVTDPFPSIFNLPVKPTNNKRVTSNSNLKPCPDQGKLSNSKGQKTQLTKALIEKVSKNSKKNSTRNIKKGEIYTSYFK